MADINIKNSSSTDRQFQIAGNDGSSQTVTVKAGQDLALQKADGWSGSVMAVHNGQVGEQSELSFGQGSGVDTFDQSNIVGGSGNMTVQQTGNDSTLKGDPTFMQDLKQAYAGLSSSQKQQLGSSVHTDSSGSAIGIDAPKSNQNLENFVNTFAKGQTYVGIGAWGDSNGAKADNAQSEASGNGHSATINVTDDNVAANATGGGGGIVRDGVSADHAASTNTSASTTAASPATSTAPASAQPAASASTASVASSSDSSVQSGSGDSFWSIAAKSGKSIQSVVDANRELMAQYPSINNPPGSFNLPAGVTVKLP